MTASALPNSVDAMLELLASRGYLAERSLATVTYLFAGSLEHRDSLGTVREIHPGDGPQNGQAVGALRRMVQ